MILPLDIVAAAIFLMLAAICFALGRQHRQIKALRQEMLTALGRGLRETVDSKQEAALWRAAALGAPGVTPTTAPDLAKIAKDLGPLPSVIEAGEIARRRQYRDIYGDDDDTDAFPSHE